MRASTSRAPSRCAFAAENQIELVGHHARRRKQESQEDQREDRRSRRDSAGCSPISAASRLFGLDWR
jgi:hypothetical protein